MKRLMLCTLYLVLLGLLFTACTPPAPSVDTTDTLSPATGESEAPTETAAPEVPAFDGTFATDAYAVTCVGDQFYLNFNESHKATSAEISACYEAGITFESLTDFKDKLINGKLTASEQITMQAAFPKDENGILMCDLTQLYEPVLPDGTTLSSYVYWLGGNSISFAFTKGYVHFLSEKAYNSLVAQEYTNAPNTTNYTITATYEGTYDSAPCEWIEFTIQGSQFRTCRMEITVNEQVFYAVLIYAITTEETANAESSTEPLPFSVAVFSEVNNQYFQVSLISPSFHPTVEWLTSFGVKLYDDNSNHVAS